MVDQPGAGGARSYKIRGYTRERQSAKPYARPPGRKKGVIETVKEFFSPAWLVDLFKGTQRSQGIEIEDAEDEDDHDEVSQRIEQSSSVNSNERTFSRLDQKVSAPTKVGINGQLGSSFGPGYFSSILREHELSSETPSTSRPSRTFGLSSGDDHPAEASTSSGRSEECESEVPKSRNEEDVAQLETVVEEDLSMVQTHRQERSKSDSIKTSTPALFSTSGIKRRPNTSIFGEPSPMTKASTAGEANTSRPQLFKPLSESRPQPYSLPKNRPSFSVAAFGSPLPPMPPQPGGFSSPFYRGRTSFGGASSLHSAGYKRMRTHSPTLGEAPKPVRKVITPKPVSTAGSSGVTSQTAKRILEALESMSSPLIDARKIPTPPISPSASPLSFLPAKQRRAPLPPRGIGSPHSLKAHFASPPVQDLSAPRRAAISQLKAKEPVTPESVATSSPSLFSTATTTIPTFSKPSVSSFTPTPLPVSLSPSSSKAGGKVKSARSTGHYTQREKGGADRSEAEVVNRIPEVVAPVPLALPNGKSLPSFTFKPTSQAETKRSSARNEMPISTAPATTSVDFTKNNFKFSSPEAKVPAFSQTSASVTQNSSNKITFSFSQPVPVSKSVDDTGNLTVSNKPEKIIISETKQTEKQMEPNNNLLKTFAPLPGSWTCDTCLVSNKATDVKCIACQSSKPSTGKPAPKKPPPSSNDLMKKFAPPVGSWSCDTCMLDNDASKTKCVACETPKPGVKPQVLSSKPVVNSDQDLMKKFAPPADSWTCDTCMLQNKSTDSTCVACHSPQPGATKTTTATTTPSLGISSNAAPDSSLAAKFAPPAGSWTCDTCMISNKSDDSACIACQTPKPGAKPGTVTAGGILGSQTFSSSPFKFPVNNSLNSNFSSMPSIKFGVGSSDVKTKGESTSSPYIFGSSTADQSSKDDSKQEESTAKLSATFKFGSSSSQLSDSRAGEPKTNAVPIRFGFFPDNQTDKGESNKVTFNSSANKDNPSSGGFTFGANQACPESSNKGKLNSIAEAAANGLLKVPEMKEPANLEQTSKQTGAGMSIADAAKTGLLKVPTAGERKVDSAAPPNYVNLFALAQTTAGSSSSKPDTSSNSSLAAGSSGFSFTAPSGAPSPFSVGAATPSSSATTSAGDSGSSVPDSKPFTNPLVPAESSLTTFQFGAASTSATSTSSQAVSSTSLAPSPFVFQAVNTTAPAKTTVASPFTFLANATGPSTTPAATFSFGSNAAGTAASATTATFQFAQQNAETAGALKPQPQASTGAGRLFQFAATNAAAAAVTTATTQLPSQTFGITSTPVSSSSEVVKPFAFNAGSTAQGFSFAPAQPSGTAGGLQSTFAFGAAAPKPGATFSGFAPAQPSSSQQTPFMFGPPSSNPTPTPEETMEADGNNSSGNLFAASANPTGNAFGSTGPSAGGFAFGVPSAPSAGGFNFAGAAQANTGPNTFAFGAGVGGAPAFGANTAPTGGASVPGGFNFSAVAANNNIESPGMFNFAAGGVTPSGGSLFTAGASGDPSNPAKAQRKFKKAVRRTNKR